MQSDIATFESNHLTITAMARSCGVSLRTLRFYEQIGLVEPQRVGTQRLYSSKDKARVALILTGKRLGFSLREISNMLRSHQSQNRPEAVELVATLDLETIAQQIASLERQKADIEEAIIELRMMLDASTANPTGS